MSARKIHGAINCREAVLHQTDCFEREGFFSFSSKHQCCWRNENSFVYMDVLLKILF